MNRRKMMDRFDSGNRAAIEFLVARTVDAISLIRQYKNFVFAVIMTVILYFPALKNGSINAGFLYMGDVLGFYLPMLAKMQALISSFNFTAIDFSMFNGSSDYFLAANGYGYHPLIVLYSLLVSAKTTTLQQLGHALVVMLAVHTFLACFYSLKLSSRFFEFEFGAAGLIATTFAFSTYLIQSCGEPIYLLCISIIPWAAYCALDYADKPNFRKLVFACLPIIFGFMGGYVPLALASFVLSIILAATKILFLGDVALSLEDKLRKLFTAFLPYICATLIVSFYLYSVYRFLQASPSNETPSLFYSAHQLAELPQSVIRLISTSFSVPGPFYEFSLHWGFIALVIIAIFFCSRDAIETLTPRDWTIVKVSTAIYAITILSIFGDSSAVSDLVYYFVPQIGKMHIYQRFLMVANILFGMIIAVMLRALIQSRPLHIIKGALITLTFTTFVSAYLMAYYPAFMVGIGLNNGIVFELILALMFVSALIVPSRIFVYSVAIALSFLPTLNGMYAYSQSTNTFAEQQKRHVIVLDEIKRAELVSYFKRLSHKEVIRYVDITPRWTNDGVETFPKSFPYFVLNNVTLSSYTGFNFYLSVRNDYMKRMPIQGQNVVLNPDWTLLEDTGADFIVAQDADVQDGGVLHSLFASVKKEDVFRLPNDVVIFPFKEPNNQEPSSVVAFDNGYFRVSPIATRQEQENLALNKPAKMSSTFGEADAHLAVDGNTDGNFLHGSVSHSNRDPNAWLEIDLGAPKLIDSVVVWNRTDCCAERLKDFAFFISQTPFLPGDTATTLQRRTGTWGTISHFFNSPKNIINVGGVMGRYVRVQLPGNQPINESFLHLAEVQVFGPRIPEARQTNSDVQVKNFVTNGANYLRLDVQSSKPATIQYLFSNNPRLHYYLNGRSVVLTDQNGLQTINVPAGFNSLEIRYKHWPLRFFWIIYTLYGVTFLWMLIVPLFKASIWGKLFRRN